VPPGTRELTQKTLQQREPLQGLLLPKWAWVELNYRAHAYQDTAARQADAGRR
jgi:hypothetical protein